MSLVQFFAWVVRIAIVLALVGELKFCTLQMLGLSAAKSERGMISYSRYTRMLTR